MLPGKQPPQPTKKRLAVPAIIGNGDEVLPLARIQDDTSDIVSGVSVFGWRNGQIIPKFSGQLIPKFTATASRRKENDNAMIPPLKNLAGNDVSIFLFRFDLSDDGIAFVLNEGIAADMYAEVDERLLPLTHACGETLLRYRRLSKGSTIMDGSILTDGDFEVALSSGLGQYFPETEKQALFADARRIADLLITVMDRRSKEEQEGKQRGLARTPAQPDPLRVKRGLERLGEAERLRAEARWAAEGKRVRPGLRRLRPEDLPPDVRATRGYDQRGACLTFAHDTLGELGKIVLVKLREDRMLVEAELYIGPEAMDTPLAKQKQRLFEQVVATVKSGFLENFPA